MSLMLSREESLRRAQMMQLPNFDSLPYMEVLRGISCYVLLIEIRCLVEMSCHEREAVCVGCVLVSSRWFGVAYYRSRHDTCGRGLRFRLIRDIFLFHSSLHFHLHLADVLSYTGVHLRVLDA